MSLAENFNPITHTDQFLVKKKGMSSDQKTPNALRNLIKNHQEQEQYKQSKPFSKKYGSQNTTYKQSNKPVAQSRQSYSNQPKSEKEIAVTVGKGEVQQKNNTKHSFNKKLINNIIKDETEPSSNQSQSNKVKKAGDGKLLSPKKTRDNLLQLNQEEGKLQRQILEIHKSTKEQLERIKQNYKLGSKKLSAYLSQSANQQKKGINQQQSEHCEPVLEKLDLLMKQKSKQLLKLQHKISSNDYILFLQKMPQNIDQMNSSQEDDVVQELPQEKPKIQGSHGSYSITMTSMRSKNYALNQRRTYDVFKGEEEKSENMSQFRAQTAKEEVIKEEGQNRMTLNQKFKDFLLN